MRTSSLLPFAAAAIPVFSALCALSVSAVPLPAASDDALALVPPDSVAVGVVRLSELRSNPLSSRLFGDLDRHTVHGDAARFLEETRLDPKKDVDVAVVAGSPKASGHEGDGLVLFEGRFDPERLTAAVVLRGGTRQSTPNGDLFVLHDDNAKEKRPGRTHEGAVAFVSRKLVIAGPEESVRKALGDRAAGGTGFLAGKGIGKQMSRIGKGAAIWAIVDPSRLGDRERKHGSDAAEGLVAAMRSVSLLVFQASPKDEGMTFSAAGLSPSAETRDNLEDALRGILAVWRMASQDEHPEMVSVLRKFRIEKKGDAVTVSGTLPASALKAMAEKKNGHASRD